MAGSSDQNEAALDFQRALAKLKPLGFRNPLLPPMPPLGSSWMQFPLWVLFKQSASEGELEEFRNIFNFWNFSDVQENSLNGLPFSIPWFTETESSVELGATSNVPLGNFEVESLGSEPLAPSEPDADGSNLAETKLSERNELPENQIGDRFTSNADPTPARRDPDLAPIGLDKAASSPVPDIDDSYPQSSTVPEVVPIGVENSEFNALAHNAPLGFRGAETPSHQLPKDSSAVEADAEFIAVDSSTSEFSAPLSAEDLPSTAEHLTAEHAEHSAEKVQETQPSTPQNAPSERDLDVDVFSRADRTEALLPDRIVEQEANSIGDAQAVNSLTPSAETILPGKLRQSGPESVDINYRPLTSPPELLQEASETNVSLELQPVENSHGLSSEDGDSDEIAFESTVPTQTVLGDAASAEVTTDRPARSDIDPSKGEATQVDTPLAELQVAESQVAIPRTEDSQLNERATQPMILAQESWAEPHNLVPQSAQFEPRQLDASDPASAESPLEDFSSLESSSLDIADGLKSEQTGSSIATSDSYQQPIQEPSREFFAEVLEDFNKNTFSFEPTVILDVSDTPTSPENTQQRLDAIADSSLPSIESKSDSISQAGSLALEPNSEVEDPSTANAAECIEASNEGISQNTLPEDRPTELVLPHESASLSSVDPSAAPSEESAHLVEFNELVGLPTGDVSPISLIPQQDSNTADVKVENLEQTNFEHSDSFVDNEADLNEVSGLREIAELAESQLNAPAELPSSSDEQPFELLSPVTFLQEIDRAQTTSFFTDRQSVSMPAEEQLDASSKEPSTPTVANPTVSVSEVSSQTIPIDANEPPGEFKDKSQNTSQREPDQGQTQDAFDGDLESATLLAEIPKQAEPTKALSWLQRSVDWLKSRLGGSSDTAETMQVSTENSENPIDSDSENSGILPAPSSQVEASKIDRTLIDRTLSPQADQVFEIPPATDPSSDISYPESDSNAPTDINNDASTGRSIEGKSQASSFEVERSVIWLEPPADNIQVSNTPVSEGSSKQQTEQTMPPSEMLHRPEIETEAYPLGEETTLENLLEIDGDTALNLSDTNAFSALGETAEFTLDPSALPTSAHEAIASVDLEKIQDPDPVLLNETEPLPDALANQSSRSSEQLRLNILPLAPLERPVSPTGSDISRAEETALDLPSSSENDNVPISNNDSRANVNLPTEGVSERSEELSSQSDRQSSFGISEKSQEINLDPFADNSPSSLEQSLSIASQEQASGSARDASTDENVVHSEIEALESTQSQYLSDSQDLSTNAVVSEESPTILQESAYQGTSQLENNDLVSEASAELSSPSENPSQELEGAFISQASDSLLEDRVNIPLSGSQQENPLQEFDTKSELKSHSAGSLPKTFLLVPDEAADLPSSFSQFEANNLQSTFANVQDEPAVSEENVLSEASEDISTRTAEDRSVHAVQSDILAEQVVDEDRTSAFPEQATANAESDNAESDSLQIEERADALAVEENQFSNFGERTILQVSTETTESGDTSTPVVNSGNDKSTQSGSSVETSDHIQSSFSPQLDHSIDSSSSLGRDIDPTHRSATEDATQSASNTELLRTPSNAKLQSPPVETEAATIPSSSQNASENLVTQSSAEDIPETEAVQPFEQWPASGSPRTNRNLDKFDTPETFSTADSVVSAQTTVDNEQSRFLPEDQANAINPGHDPGHDQGSELFENTVLQVSPKVNIPDSTAAIASNLSESDLSEPSINVGFEPSLAKDLSSSEQEALRTTQLPPAQNNSAEPEDRGNAVQGENTFSAPAIGNEGFGGLDPLSPLQSSESENRFKRPDTSDAENTVLQAEPESVVPKVGTSDSATSSATDRTSELESPQNLVESENSDSLNPSQNPDISGDRFKRPATVEESTILQASEAEAVVSNAITPDFIVPITTNRLDELNPQQNAPASQEIDNLVDVVDGDFEDRNHKPIIGLVDSTEKISASREPIGQSSDNVAGNLLYRNDGISLPEMNESLSSSQRQDIDIVSEQFIPQVVSPADFYPDSYRQPPEAIVSNPSKPNLSANLPESNEPKSHGAQVSQELQQHSYGQDGSPTPPPLAAPDSLFSDRFDSGFQSNRQSSEGDLSPEVNEVDGSQGEENTVLQAAPVSVALPNVDPTNVDRTNIQSDSSIEQSSFTEPRGTVSASSSTNAIASNSAGSDLADSNAEAELESGAIAPETKANQPTNDSDPSLRVPLNTALGGDFSVSPTGIRSESISFNNTDARESRTESQSSGEIEVKGFQNEESTFLQASPVEESASDVNRANLQSGSPIDSSVQQPNLADPTASAQAPEALSSLPSQEPVDTQSVFTQQNNAIDSSVEGDSFDSDLGGMGERTATAFQDFGERDFDPSAQPTARSAEPVQPDNSNQGLAPQTRFTQGEVSEPSGNAISDSSRSLLKSQARPSFEPVPIEEQTSIQEKSVSSASENSSEVVKNFTSEQSESVPESQSQPSSIAVEGAFCQDSQDILGHSSDPSQSTQSSQSSARINVPDRTQAASFPDPFTFVQDREPFQAEESTDRQIDVENNAENPDLVSFPSSNAALDAESISSGDFKSTNTNTNTSSNSTNATSPTEERTVLQQHESRTNPAADSVGETFSSGEVDYNRSTFNPSTVGRQQQEPERSSPSYPRDDLSDRMPNDASDFESRSFEQNTSETQSDFAQVSAAPSPEAWAESTVLQDVPDESNRSVDSPTSVQSSRDVNQPPSDSGPKLSETSTELQNPQTPDKPWTDGQSTIEDRSIQPSEFVDSSLSAQPHYSDAPSLRNNGLPQSPRSEFESPISNQPESLTNTPDDLNGRAFDTTNSSQLNREKYNSSVSDSAAIADSPRSPNPLPSSDWQGPSQNVMLQNNAATNSLSSRSSPQVAAPESWSSLEDLLSLGQNTLTQGSNNTVGNLMQAGNTLTAQALIDRPPMDSPEDFFKDVQGYSTPERGNVPLPEAWETLSDLINNIKLPGTEAQELEIEDVIEPSEEAQATVNQIEFADKIQIQPATVESVDPKELQVLRQNLYERIQNQFEIERERQGNAFKNPPSFDLYSIDSTPEFNPTFLMEERLPTALSAYFYEVVQANESPLSTDDTWEIYQQMRYECELERERQGIYFWENRSSSSDTGF